MKKNFIMPDDDYELFELIVKSSQKKLMKTLYKVLKRHYNYIINTPDYLVAKGDIPIALVAHMDTVFSLPPEDIYFDRQKNVLWSPDGLGADDRAGVFIILKILQIINKYKKPTIIFTTDEEKGCVGSCALISNYNQTPWPLKYIIQLDRRGKFDCVFYDDANKEFEQYVETFGFKTNYGSLSDISVICPGWGISGVNLSVGYEDEHQEIETLHIQYTYITMHKVLNMLKDCDNAPFFEYKGFKYKWWMSYYAYPGYDDEYDFDNDKGDTYCKGCGKKIQKSLSVKAKDCYGNFHSYCDKCVSDIVDWCEECGCAFIPEDKFQKTCCDCINDSWKDKKINVQYNKNSKSV